jgi:hypothetical protein
MLKLFARQLCDITAILLVAFEHPGNDRVFLQIAIEGIDEVLGIAQQQRAELSQKFYFLRADAEEIDERLIDGVLVITASTASESGIAFIRPGRHGMAPEFVYLSGDFPSPALNSDISTLP